MLKNSLAILVGIDLMENGARTHCLNPMTLFFHLHSLERLTPVQMVSKISVQTNQASKSLRETI